LPLQLYQKVLKLAYVALNGNTGSQKEQGDRAQSGTLRARLKRYELPAKIGIAQTQFSEIEWETTTIAGASPTHPPSTKGNQDG